MAPKLGELLVQEGVITRKQLDEALKCQVIFGGRLGTNLVEMGYIEEQKLVEILSRQLDAPYVTPEQLASIPPDVINLISKEMAEEYKIIPISLEKKKLTVAIWDPSDLSALDAISFITGYIIKPLVCSELRLLLSLEKYYGIKREVRYIQLKGGSGTRSREAKPESARADEDVHDISPFQDMMDELPPPMEGETGGVWGEVPEIEPAVPASVSLLKPSATPPSQARLGVEPGVVDLAPPPQPPQPAPIQPAQVRPAPAAPPLTPQPAPPAVPVAPAVQEAPERTMVETGASLLSVLAEAENRDAIADALVGFLGRDFDRVALFMVKGRAAIGWRGVLRYAPIPGFEHLHIPLDEPTLLKVVTDTKNFYLGPVLDSPGNTRILAGLGGGEPDSALLIPLIMMERVVAVFYVDGDKSLLGRKLFELQRLIGKASLAFEILILKNKIMMA